MDQEFSNFSDFPPWGDYMSLQVIDIYQILIENKFLKIKYYNFDQ